MTIEDIKTLNKDNVFEQLDALWASTSDDEITTGEMKDLQDAIIARFDEIRQELPEDESLAMLEKLASWLIHHAAELKKDVS